MRRKNLWAANDAEVIGRLIEIAVPEGAQSAQVSDLEWTIPSFDQAAATQAGGLCAPKLQVGLSVDERA